MSIWCQRVWWAGVSSPSLTICQKRQLHFLLIISMSEVALYAQLISLLWMWSHHVTSRICLWHSCERILDSWSQWQAESMSSVRIRGQIIQAFGIYVASWIMIITYWSESFKGKTWLKSKADTTSYIIWMTVSFRWLNGIKIHDVIHQFSYWTQRHWVVGIQKPGSAVWFSATTYVFQVLMMTHWSLIDNQLCLRQIRQKNAVS